MRPDGNGFPSGRVAVKLCVEMKEESSGSLGRTIVAVLVLLVAGWFLLHFVIHIVVWLASIVVVAAAIFALVWALRVLL